MGYSYFKLLDKDQVPQLYAVRLRDEIAHFMNQTEGKEIDSVKLIINSIGGIDDPNKNISRETLTINTAFRLLALIMRNSSTFLPILGLSTLKPIYQSPINVIVTLKNGEQITREIFTNEQKYFEP